MTEGLAVAKDDDWKAEWDNNVMAQGVAAVVDGPARRGEMIAGCLQTGENYGRDNSLAGVSTDAASNT